MSRLNFGPMADRWKRNKQTGVPMTQPGARSLRDDLRERMNAPGPTVTITKAQLVYLLQAVRLPTVEQLAVVLHREGLGCHSDYCFDWYGERDGRKTDDPSQTHYRRAATILAALAEQP
jgi:hypothetical protein